MDSLSLAQTKDSRFGSGVCNNFSLYENCNPFVKQLASDIRQIVKDQFGREIYGLENDSFFNIFRGAAGTRKHCHISPQDKFFNLESYKITLVYYLSCGDCDADFPGILKLYDPFVEIMPHDGLMIIAPSGRFHSSYYSGSKDRIMIGSNFYAF